MAGRITFPSLKDPKSAYTIHESTYELRDEFHRLNGLAPWAGIFATFGDGLTQHGPESVAPKACFEDYLASLATYLEDPNAYRHAEAIDWLAQHWPRDVDAKRVRFLATLKHDPDKPRWYALRENKVSAADSRRHDKRWREIPSGTKGTAESVFYLFTEEEGLAEGTIGAWSRYRQIHDIILHDCGGWGKPADVFFGLDKGHVCSIFPCVANLVKAHRATEQAARCLRSWRYNTTPAVDEPSEVEPAAVAV